MCDILMSIEESIHSPELGFLTLDIRIMCPSREWSNNYKAFSGGVVLMENNTSCRTMAYETLSFTCLMVWYGHL